MSKDIFISYARNDNQAARENSTSIGFVTAIHERISANFAALGPPTPSVFRDTEQISSEQQFEQRLGAALDAARFMVVVLSRNWLVSKWCVLELETFVGKWQKRGESEQQIKERLFLVLKHVVPPENRPPWLQGQSGFPLVMLDKESNTEVDFYDAAQDKVRRGEWFTQLEDLATRLRARIQGGADPTAAGPRADPSGTQAARATVYLARPAADMLPSYETLYEELTRRKIRVVPDPGEEIPTNGREAIERIDAALGEAALSIHLVGDKLGFQPEDATPIVRLQLDRAAGLAQSDAGDPRPFHRLLWVPRVVPGAPPDAAARDPFKSLAEHYKGAFVIAPGDKVEGDTLAKFTQFAIQHLDEMTQPPGPASRDVAAGSQVYVQHGEDDAAVAEGVAEVLSRLGYTPLLPILQGAPADREQVHRDALRAADAVLLCWAQASAFWVRSRASELRNWQDLGRTRAFQTRAVVELPPDTPDKQRLRRFPIPQAIDGTLDASKAWEPDQFAIVLQKLLVPTP